MSKDGTEIVNPPWVYGPSEMKEWIDATYPARKDKKKKKEKRSILQDVRISIDIKGEKKSLTGLKLFGFERVEEHFNVIEIVQILLRGFARAGFRNVEEIRMDNQNIYRHPELRYDIRKIIEFVGKYRKGDFKRAELKVLFEENCEVKVTIKKIHARRSAPIELFFDGSIEKERLSRFLNYIKEHREIEFLYRHSP